ncbi:MULTISPECIES: Smr/MutS family protein [Rhodomicrobium]|uniref:Smr/MutS family protein n=1 Tax=Rhodomicrobium TaxID=1068 RepID=UPI000B4AFC20|nr:MULTISPECIES: Smr/MutS family protein [Rhodomicrobium]
MNSEPPSRKRPLTAEEAELWTYAMREANALRRRGREEKREAERLADEAKAERFAPEPSPATKVQPAAKPSADKRPERRPPPPKSPPPLAPFDDRDRRKLSRDRDLIDARLDLHGMRQREAHGALRAFLFACVTRGHRHVLVITGKGVRADVERVRDHFIEERGVLRRLVPQWLADADLRGIVVSYTAAGVRHGGDGALYIRLRKQGAGG